MNLLDLFVKIGVEDEASDKVSKLSGKIGSGLKTAAKIGVAAVAAVATGIGALGMQAVQSYADYEQLAGGVETLFGKSAGIVQEYADRAYETAGLSANAYMETVTSFSASLLQSLGNDTEAAAEYADMAITDMSDNANKMGSSMESIQNAYQGFAKQNFTMLDNLKLGYGGTKEEMQRLLEDAQAISGIEYDISSYADIVDAIHVIQTEMGITGTTAKEASQTISGSVSAMKAAWENLLVAVASDDMDVGEYVEKLVDSAFTAANNILPRITQVLSSVGDLVQTLVPTILAEASGLIQQVLPSLLDSAVNLVVQLMTSLSEMLPSLISDSILPALLLITDAILSMLPDIALTATQIIASLVEGIAEAAPTLIPAAVEAILSLVDGLINNIDLLIDAAIALVRGLADGILAALPILVEQVPALIGKLINAIIDNLPLILTTGVEIIMALVSGIVSAIPTLIGEIANMVADVLANIWETDWGAVGLDLIKTIAKGISDAAVSLLSSLEAAFDPAQNWIKKLISAAPSWGKDMIQGIIDGIRNMISKVKSAAQDVAKAISDFLHFSRPETGPLREYERWMPDMIDGMVAGIEDNKHKLADAIAGMAGDMSVSMSSDGASGGNAGGTKSNSFVINVYGAEGQSVSELADAVMERMQAAVARKDAVFV